MELNSGNLQSKANKAERVICERLRDPTPTFHERTALHNALRELQLLFNQNSKQQESREMKNTHVRLLPRTGAAAAKISRRRAAPNQRNAKVLQISSTAVKGTNAQREEGPQRS
jgi:hypothetical protein